MHRVFNTPVKSVEMEHKRSTEDISSRENNVSGRMRVCVRSRADQHLTSDLNSCGDHGSCTGLSCFGAQQQLLLLLRQCKDVDGVVAAGHVCLGRYAELGSSNGAAAGSNGNVLPAIDRISDGAANSLRRKTRLPNDLARVCIERA